MLRRIHKGFEHFASRTSTAAGSPWAFSIALISILVWAFTGPAFDYSEAWQLVVNTGTTIITFLMVFLIQHAQNKDIRAVHLKLDEIVAAVEGASNSLIDAEDLSDDELERLSHRYQGLAKHALQLSQGAKTSIDENSDDDRKAKG